MLYVVPICAHTTHTEGTQSDLTICTCSPVCWTQSGDLANSFRLISVVSHIGSSSSSGESRPIRLGLQILFKLFSLKKNALLIVVLPMLNVNTNWNGKISFYIVLKTNSVLFCQKWRYFAFDKTCCHDQPAVIVLT